MPLANNQREQLGSRLEADIGLREPGLTITKSLGADNEPIFLVSSGGNEEAAFAIEKRSFDGFNVVAELSSSAAEGLPEHITWLAIDTGATQLFAAKMMQLAVNVFASSIKMVFEASITVASVLDESKVAEELSNDARNGASGN